MKPIEASLYFILLFLIFSLILHFRFYSNSIVAGGLGVIS